MPHRTLPLVLLPAMGCDGRLWARQVVALGDITHPELGDLTVDATLQASIPGACFRPIRRCGHLAPMERPGEVTALLRAFLTDRLYDA